MSQLLTKLQENLLHAQKMGDRTKISILRFMLAKIHDAQIAKGKESILSDDELRAEIVKEVKRHAESIEAYEAADRLDLVEKERLELVILENYLPKRLTQAQIATIVTAAIKETAASSLGDMSKVMAAVMPKVGARADGAQVLGIVKNLLGGKSH